MTDTEARQKRIEELLKELLRRLDKLEDRQDRLREQLLRLPSGGYQ